MATIMIRTKTSPSKLLSLKTLGPHIQITEEGKGRKPVNQEFQYSEEVSFKNEGKIRAFANKLFVTGRSITRNAKERSLVQMETTTLDDNLELLEEMNRARNYNYVDICNILVFYEI